MSLPRGLKAAIWDFNGTLVDDLDLAVESVNVLLDRRGLPRLTVRRFRDVFGFPIEAYYRRIGFDLQAESMPDLAAEFFSDYAPRLTDCDLHVGVVEALGDLRAASVAQFVLSAMEESMLRDMLVAFGIAEYFDGAYGLDHQEGDSKVRRGARLLRDFSLDPSATVMIGDTDHDADVAADLGTCAILVASGHQSERRLRATGRPVVSDLRGLTDVLADIE